ncbi:polyamine transport protein PotC [Pseudomonas aeruginosa]|nr:polyamine transport protein PotC [Pseudomonas aeruginosa]
MRRPYLLWSATALVYLFLYVPLVIVVLYSFNDSRLNAEWVGFTLDWYRKLFGNRDMLQAAANSLVIALVSASVATLLGTLAGVALHRFKLRVLPLLVLTPIAIPELLMGVSLVIFFIGLNMSLGMLSVTLAHITFSVGFVALVVQARMSGMDESLTEAARDLGATPWQSFRLVTLPLIMPGIVAGALMAFTPVHRRLRDHLLHRRRRLRHPADADLHHDQDRRDARSERRLHPADAAHPGANRDRLETLPQRHQGPLIRRNPRASRRGPRPCPAPVSGALPPRNKEP